MLARISLVGIIFLSGCMSYSEIQKRPPALEIESTKQPDIYAGCVAPKFMEIWPGLVTVIPDGKNAAVTVAGGGTVMATLTISPTTTGSYIVLREMPHVNLGNAYKRGQSAAQSCR